MKDIKKGSPTDFMLVQLRMIDKFLLFNTQETTKAEASAWFHKLINELKGVGWSRRYVWELISKVYSIQNLRDELIDIVGDYEHSLVGFCSLENTDQFPGDPEDIIELNKYVSNKKWKEE